MRVLIVGAGIGGTTLALALERAGIDYLLLEQAQEFAEVGAGIQLSPNGVRVLEALGLADELREFCVEPDAHHYKDWQSGETVLRTTLMPEVRGEFGAAYYHAHRADLIEALGRGVDPAKLALGMRVNRVGQDADGVWAETDDGQRLTGDVLIGADGIHSMVRDQLFEQKPPRRSGYVIWRGVVDAERVAGLDIPVSSYVCMGPRMSFVFYYVSARRKLNWLAFGMTEDEKRESWAQTATKEEVLACFEGWYEVPPALIRATETPFVTALFDRDPLEAWVQGRIALTGDAAHAMLPYHAQGAVQSIEDAWVLARALELEAGDAAAALKRFEVLRKGRADALVGHSRAAEKWYHVDDPAEVAVRNKRFRAMDEKYAGSFVPQQVWLYRYDAEKAVLGTDDEWRALTW